MGTDRHKLTASKGADELAVYPPWDTQGSFPLPFSLILRIAEPGPGYRSLVPLLYPCSKYELIEKYDKQIGANKSSIPFGQTGLSCEFTYRSIHMVS